MSETSVRAKMLLVVGGAVFVLFGCGRVADQGSTAGADGKPSEALAIGPLDPADPAQLAVMKWHQSLVADDFDLYSSLAVRGDEESDEMRAFWFDAMRQGVPATVLVNDGTQAMASIVSQDLRDMKSYVLVGCVPLAADGRNARVMAVVSAREIGGKWRVYGGSFGPPSTPFAGSCPIMSAAATTAAGK